MAIAKPISWPQLGQHIKGDFGISANRIKLHDKSSSPRTAFHLNKQFAISIHSKLAVCAHPPAQYSALQWHLHLSLPESKTRLLQNIRQHPSQNLRCVTLASKSCRLRPRQGCRSAAIRLHEHTGIHLNDVTIFLDMQIYDRLPPCTSMYRCVVCIGNGRLLWSACVHARLCLFETKSCRTRVHASKTFEQTILIFIQSRLEIGHSGGCGEAQLTTRTGSHIFGPAELDKSCYQFISFVLRSTGLLLLALWHWIC